MKTFPHGMKSYRQFCPIAKASEIFAERWTPLIVRELLMGSTRFSELEWGVPGIPRSLLSQRLRFLTQSGIVERRGEGRNRYYHLTQAGQELFDIVERLGQWGQKWVNTEIHEDDVVDASLLIWDMHRRVDWERVPQRRVTIQFSIPDSRHRMFWPPGPGVRRGSGSNRGHYDLTPSVDETTGLRPSDPTGSPATRGYAADGEAIRDVVHRGPLL